MQHFSDSHRASGYLEWPGTQTAIIEKPPAEIICFVKEIICFVKMCLDGKEQLKMRQRILLHWL